MSSSESAYSSFEEDTVKKAKKPFNKKKDAEDDQEIDIGSEDSEAEDAEYDSTEDYYTDEETGEKLNEGQIMSRDREAFEMLHRIIYGGRSQSMASSAPFGGSFAKKKKAAPHQTKAKQTTNKKRSKRDLVSDSESDSSSSSEDSSSSGEEKEASPSPSKKKARSGKKKAPLVVARKQKVTASKAAKAFAGLDKEKKDESD